MLKQLQMAGMVAILALTSITAFAGAAPMGAEEFPPIFWSERMMTAMDKNRDGMVSREEYMDYMGAQYDMMDTGKKRMLTREQFMDRKMMMRTFPTSVQETGPAATKK